MEPFPREGVLACRERVIEKLLRGRGDAKELEDILASPGKNPNLDGDLMRDLAKKMRRSFDESLSALGHEVESEDISQVAVVDSPHSVTRGKPKNPEGSEGSVRSSLPTWRDRRGCYKRRSNGETWIEFTPSITADHHQWRKYGQKWIQNAVHPRNYFRCTHKTDHGCLATKQVQKISDDPTTFRTVYQGRHTCTDNRKLKSPEVVFDDQWSKNPGSGDSPLLLSFDRSNTIGSPLKKEVTSEDFCGNKGTIMLSASSDNGYLDMFGPGGDISVLSSGPGDAESVRHHGSYIDMMMGLDDPAYFALDYGSYGGELYL